MPVGNILPPYEEAIQATQEYSSQNVVQPYDDAVVIGNSSLLTTPTSRNTSTPVVINLV